MSRYLTRPVRADDDGWWDNGPMLPDIHVPDRKEVNTGLVDSLGQPIYRVQPPMGFGRDREW